MNIPSLKFVDYGNTDRVTPDLLFACPLFSYPPAFAFEVEIDALDLAQLDDPNGFFNFLHHFLDVDLCANIVTKCYPTLKVDLSLEQSGDDLVKEWGFIFIRRFSIRVVKLNPLDSAPLSPTLNR